MTYDPHIIALRDEIRREGHSLVTLRLGALLLGAAMLGLAVELALGGAAGWQRAILALLLALGLLAAGTHSIKVRRRLSRGVRSLPRADCRRLLGSLHHEGGGARILAGRHRRELERSPELAPAAAPDARGDEASPAERSPQARAASSASGRARG